MPIKPTPPAGKPIQITVRDGDSLDALAIRYNTTRASIMKANGITDPNRLSIGQTLTVYAVSDAEMKRYNDLKAEYDRQVREEKHAAEVAERTAKAEALIQKAKSDGYGREYSFKINEEGHIVITLKVNKELGDIRDDFNLKKGRLLDTNPSIKDRFVKGKGIRGSDGEYYDTWDSTVAGKGEKFVIDTGEFSTSKTFRQTCADIYHAIKLW